MRDNSGRRTTSPEGRRLAIDTVLEIAIVEAGKALVARIPGIGWIAETFVFGIRKALADEHVRLDLKELQDEMTAMRNKGSIPTVRAASASDDDPTAAINELHELITSVDESDFRIAVAAARSMARADGPEQTDPKVALAAFTNTAKEFYDSADRALKDLESWRLGSLPSDRRHHLIEVLRSMRRELDTRREHTDIENVYDANVVHDFLMARQWAGFVCLDRARQREPSLRMTPEHFYEVRQIVQSLVRRPPTDPRRIFGLTNRILAISQGAGVSIVPVDQPVDETRAYAIYHQLEHVKPNRSRSPFPYRSILLRDARGLARLPQGFPRHRRLVTSDATLVRLGDRDQSIFPSVQQSYGAAWGDFSLWAGDSIKSYDLLFDAIDAFLKELVAQGRGQKNLIELSPATRAIVISSVEAFHEDSAERLRRAGNEIDETGSRLALLFHTRIDEFIDSIDKIASDLKAFGTIGPLSTSSDDIGPLAVN